MVLKTLDSFDLKGKYVLLRADLNSDVVDGKVMMSERIKESIQTISELKNKGARVCIIAHQGNPGKKDFVSLLSHCKLLNKFVLVKFVDDIVGDLAVSSIKNLGEGDCILLDNIRNLDEELDINIKPNKIVDVLGGLFDIYINDAFSVCHRKHSSIVLLPKVIKMKCGGRLLEKEVNALKKISIKDCLYLLGGAKPETNIKLLTGKKVLAGGLFGHICLVSIGVDLGYQKKYLKETTLVKGDYMDFLSELKGKLKNVLLPDDLVIDIGGKIKALEINEFPSSYEVVDIGPKTVDKFVKEIKKAKAIYMKGPFGKTTDKKFLKGTNAILKAVSESKGFSLIGGGHLSDVISRSGISLDKFDHVSLSGGALLRYVAGEKLVGLDALG
ncbi:phosphoglycerate kinase [Candidatus Pacearchaeota archaeon]|nr:phosphoglycerate kinase [Candidatus Pacearchaeota archaeon]